MVYATRTTTILLKCELLRLTYGVYLPLMVWQQRALLFPNYCFIFHIRLRTKIRKYCQRSANITHHLWQARVTTWEDEQDSDTHISSSASVHQLNSELFSWDVTILFLLGPPFTHGHMSREASHRAIRGLMLSVRQYTKPSLCLTGILIPRPEGKSSTPVNKTRQKPITVKQL